MSGHPWNSLPVNLRDTVNTGTFKKKTDDVLILQILFNSPLNFYYDVLVVIGPVGHCCKPQPSVIIIIIIIHRRRTENLRIDCEVRCK